MRQKQGYGHLVLGTVVTPNPKCLIFGSFLLYKSLCEQRPLPYGAEMRLELKTVPTAPVLKYVVRFSAMTRPSGASSCMVRLSSTRDAGQEAGGGMGSSQYSERYPRARPGSLSRKCWHR